MTLAVERSDAHPPRGLDDDLGGSSSPEHQGGADLGKIRPARRGRGIDAENAAIGPVGVGEMVVT